MKDDQSMQECKEEKLKEGYNNKEAKNICRKKRGFKTK